MRLGHSATCLLESAGRDLAVGRGRARLGRLLQGVARDEPRRPGRCRLRER